MRSRSFCVFRGLMDAPRHPAAKHRHRPFDTAVAHLTIPATQRVKAPLKNRKREAAVATVSTGPVVHVVDFTMCPAWAALAGTWGPREPHLTSSVIWPPKVTHVPGRRHTDSSQRASPGSLDLPQSAQSSGCRAWGGGAATGHRAPLLCGEHVLGTCGHLAFRASLPLLGPPTWGTGRAWSRQPGADL